MLKNRVTQVWLGGITVLLMLTVCVPAIYSNPLPSVPGEFNGIFFRNSEVLIDEDGSGTISVGDIFWGVLQVNEIVAPTGQHGQIGPRIWPLSGVPPAEITGYFAAKVVAAYPIGDPSNPFAEALIILGPAVDPNGILVPGEVIRMYEDTNFNFNDSTQGSALASATDGTLLWSFGLGSGGGSPGGYWYTVAPVVPPGSGDVGESYAGLNVITAPPGDAFGLVNDPNEDFSSGAGVPDGLDVQFWFNSEIFRLPLNPDLTIDPDDPMHFGSNDPAVYKPEEEVVGACRMTGGNVTVNWDYVPGTYAEVKKNLPQGQKKFYTVGGQVGAPRANDPSFGEWTHTQHAGFEGSFTFHAGTNSAPEGTEISSIACDDPGWCVQARCAPFKQIFWEGIGSFKNEKGFNAGCVIAGETLHYFRAHVGDFGEPGKTGKQKNEAKCEWASGGPNIADVVFIDAVPDDKFGDKGGQECDECPDYYEIEIHCTTDPASPVIYSVGDFIDRGNFQIHPEVGQQCP